MEGLESALSRMQGARGGVASESAALQTQLEKVLLASHAQEAQLTNTVNTIKNKYTSIINEATEKANHILATAEKSAAAAQHSMTEGRKAWAEEKAALSGVQKFQPKVKLDVGGAKFTTSLTTLRRFPDTMIGAMFSGRHALPLDEDGYHFIDRDGTYFGCILNYLRSPETFDCELTGAALKKLKNECNYYGLKEFMFPFRPIPLFQTRTVGNERVTVTQDRRGIFRSQNIAVGFCPVCGAGDPHEYSEYGDDYISNFHALVEKQGGAIFRAQPRMMSPCLECGR
eukprot:gene10210-11950_t